MIKKRSYFKVLDPMLQKDTYLYLAAVWMVWTIAQALFLVFMDWNLAIEPGAGSGRTLMLGFLLLSAFMMLFAVLSINSLLNRVTGPLHRMKEDIENARRDGKRPHIRLRKGDYFQDLADSINKAIEEAPGPR